MNCEDNPNNKQASQGVEEGEEGLDPREMRDCIFRVQMEYIDREQIEDRVSEKMREGEVLSIDGLMIDKCI